MIDYECFMKEDHKLSYWNPKVIWLQITINRVKTLPQSFNSSMGQLLLIGCQIGYRIFEYWHKKLILLKFPHMHFSKFP